MQGCMHNLGYPAKHAYMPLSMKNYRDVPCLQIFLLSTLVSLLSGTAIPTCSCNFQFFIFLLLLLFCNILESISHAKALRVEREFLVPYPQSCDWRVWLVSGHWGCGCSQDQGRQRYEAWQFGGRRTSHGGVSEVARRSCSLSI